MQQLLNDFSPGLFFMQAFIFLVLLLLLAKFAWKPILQSLRIREESIQDALDAAENAKAEMTKLKADNQKLMEDARIERDNLLKEAREVANTLKEEANTAAGQQAEKMINDARQAINIEKQAALAEVKTQVAKISLQVAEKLMRQKLDVAKAQEALIEEFVKDANLN